MSTGKRLIVEGIDDQYTVINLLARHGVDWNNKKTRVEIDNAKGWTEALTALPTTIKSYERIGIILDADLSVENRWQSVCDRINAVMNDLGLSVSLPTEPDKAGTIIPLNNKCVGIWLMPNNQTIGKLEDFLSYLIPEQDYCWEYAQQATAEARKKGAMFSELDKIKACVHTWLAWQKESGLPFGTAIKARYFSHDTPEALTFVNWFNRLFFKDYL
ncbi:hypothetical protein BegalDRAFT_1398 [Beggiatoa alba B18LD]|uniref:DUF4435 domain-containing protein n=1 Tax=Beggiatoa alba B18LD TaxID=395493 RepID=I3CF99_9GAMM|nr:DUF3226 domain-containing protein [Beggiatoa alba]EIJ42292.1 hypothetical protein BegalDRAFT_1398 [Beggiatoa alba B18LD]